MHTAFHWSLGLSIISLSVIAPTAAHAQAQDMAQALARAQAQAQSNGNRGPNIPGNRYRGPRGDMNAPQIDVNRNARGPGNTPDRSVGVPPPVQGTGRINIDQRDIGQVGNNRGSGHIGDHVQPAGDHRGNVDNRPEVRGWAHRGQHSPHGRDTHGPAGRGRGHVPPYAAGLGRANFYGGWAYAAYSPRVVIAVVPLTYRGWAMNYPIANYRPIQPYRGWAYSPRARLPYRAGR